MGKARLEAFTDGVIAIIITIMVLEMKVPSGTDLAALATSAPVFSAYVLSYVNVGIFWLNHHHMMHATVHIDGRVLWANLALLFWLSLVPFVTNWMGDHPHDSLPTLIYGVVLLCAAISFTILVHVIIYVQGPDSKLKAAVGRDFKGNISMAIYVAALLSTFVEHRMAWALYALVALVWLVPDRRIERVL